MSNALKPLLQYLTRRAAVMRKIGQPKHEAKLLRWRHAVKTLQACAEVKTCDGCASLLQDTGMCASCTRLQRVDMFAKKHY